MTAITSAEVLANQDRCEQILECKHQIEFWKSKLAELEAEQTTCIKLARLRVDAATTWRYLSRMERSEKKFILAALESSGGLPTVLADFSNSSFPPHIRMDRDILLARVARSDYPLPKYSQSNLATNTTNVTERERIFVPPKLRRDKEVILAMLPKHPEVVECMSPELRDDEDVLDTLLLQTGRKGRAPLPTYFLQHFSDRIKSSEEIMMRVLQHPRGLSSLAYCCPDLRNDKSFILRAIENGHHGSETQVLRYASQRLRADRDVVYSAVRKSGLNLKHASYILRRDKGVVLAASTENGTAFRYCLPGTVKDELLQNRDFVLTVVRSAPNVIVRSCPEPFKSDREVLFHAAVHGLDFSALPEDLQTDSSFLAEVMKLNANRYMDLPESTQEVKEVAFAVVQAPDVDDDVILEATVRCPQLLSNELAMSAIVNRKETDILPETLQFSPLCIRANKDIMLPAVENDSVAFEYCSDDLQHDRDVVSAAIPTSLYLVMDEFQYENPEIVVAAIEKTPSNDLWITYDDIYDALWTNRDVALAWLSRGGDWLFDDFPEEWTDDRELLLTMAKNNWAGFDVASTRLKYEKEFMLEALRIDGRIIRDIVEDLRYDDDIALMAFSTDQRALQYYSGAEDFEFMTAFTKRVRQQLSNYYMFQNEVAKAISSAQESRLSMLNQGPEMTRFYVDTLASFVGLENAEELKLLEKTSQSLLAWGW